MKTKFTLRKKIALFASALFLSIYSFAFVGNGSLGTNLCGHGFYSTVPVFKDLGRYAQGWYRSNSNPWQEIAASDLTSQRIPKKSLFVSGYQVSCVLIDNGFYDSGKYNIYFDIESGGNVTLTVGRDGTGLTKISNTHYTFNATAKQYGITISMSNMTGQVSNLRIVHDNDVSTYQSAPFRASFVSDIEHFGVIRFMDWMRTNKSPVVNYNDAFYSSIKWGGGATMGEMANLCNQLGTDFWITVPERASDSYCRSVCGILKSRLNVNRKIWVEYSNEPWNTAQGFSLYSYCRDKGRELWPTMTNLNDTEISNRYYAYRAKQIHDIFDAQLTASRCVRVVGGQAAIDWITGNIITNYRNFNGNKNPEAAAIAPYFGVSIQSSGGIGSAITGYTTSQLHNYVMNGTGEGSLEKVRQWIVANRSRIPTGVQMIAYEGGQHFLQEGNQTLYNLFIGYNRSELIYDAYKKLLNIWKDNGGQLFVHFASGGRFSTSASNQEGFYPHRENVTRTLTKASSPKWTALVDFMAANPKWWTVPNTRAEIEDEDISVSKSYGLVNLYPNPASSENVTVTMPADEPCKIEIYDALGYKVHEGTSTESNYVFNVSAFAKGIYSVCVCAPQQTYRARLVVE